MLVIAGLALYVGFQVIGDEFDYRSLSEEAQRQAILAGEQTDEEIREGLVRRARELGLSSSAERIRVRRLPGDRVSIGLQYADTVSLFDRWEWVRPRRIDVREEY